jgi:hypothetical protein
MTRCQELLAQAFEVSPSQSAGDDHAPGRRCRRQPGQVATSLVMMRGLP